MSFAEMMGHDIPQGYDAEGYTRQTNTTFDCTLLAETPKAWLIQREDNLTGVKSQAWVPKSKCKYDDGIVTIPDWLYNKLTFKEL